MRIDSYTQFGGRHPETAAVTNALAAYGVTAPHSGTPYSEAMVLGVGGGLGAGYILWEFKKYARAILVMGFQYRWNYTTEYFERLLSQLGGAVTYHETGSQNKAARDLAAALEAGDPAVAWVDQMHLPYFGLPEMTDGCFGHFVTVVGIDEPVGTVTLDDRAHVPLTMDADVFAAARGRIGSYKNRLMTITPPRETNLEAAVSSGIQACISYLGDSSTSFAIPVYKKWGRLMTHETNKKGWPVVFASRNGLYGTLASLFEGIELLVTGGSGLRDLYADFLDEAETVLGNPRLRDVAAHYRALGERWTAFAEAALPDYVQSFSRAKALLRRRYDLLISEGPAGFAEMALITAELNALDAQLNDDFPLSDDDTMALFADLQQHLLGIHDAEAEALAALSAAVE